MSTVVEIESAIEKLPPAEQRELAGWLNSRLIEESPEMLAALDAGIRSLETEPKVPIEEVRRKIKTWATTALTRYNERSKSRGSGMPARIRQGSLCPEWHPAQSR